MTSIWVAEHGWSYLNAIIDCCTREIVGWELSLRCRAVEAIAVVETSRLRARHPARELTLGTDNGSAFVARATRLVLSGLGVATAAAATATPKARRSSRAGSATSKNGASGATSSRPSTRPGR